jgi:membrane-associated phospholipid phosphatase
MSDALDDRWWAAAPVYALATGVGIGRMGQDAHWASDILGSAVVGICTSKAFIKLHESHDENRKDAERCRMSAMVSPFWGSSGEKGLALRIFF